MLPFPLLQRYQISLPKRGQGLEGRKGIFGSTSVSGSRVGVDFIPNLMTYGTAARNVGNRRY